MIESMLRYFKEDFLMLKTAGYVVMLILSTVIIYPITFLVSVLYGIKYHLIKLIKK